jgi:hypothetical protein
VRMCARRDTVGTLHGTELLVFGCDQRSCWLSTGLVKFEVV